VKQNHAVGRKAIGEQSAKAVDVKLESVRFFVVRDGDIIQVHVHGFAQGNLRVTGKVYQGI
jgi:hypothetical protein